jgi:hypothetical protein
MRAVPLQARTLAALAPARDGLVFGASGAASTHNFRNRYWQPALIVAGIRRRRVYDPARFATFALLDLRASYRHLHLRSLALDRASLTMIDRHCGHLARDGREDAITLLDADAELRRTRRPRRGRPVDIDETLRRRARQQKRPLRRN